MSMKIFRRLIRHSNLASTEHLNRSFNSFGWCKAVDNADLKKQLEKQTTEQPTTTPTAKPTTTTTTEPTTPNPVDMSKYRLPTNVKPHRYDLYLYPDLETGLFRGTVATDAEVVETTSTIVMHSHLLNIDGVSLDGTAGEFDLDSKYELLNIRKSDGSEFEQGKNVSVTVAFNGDMKYRIVGLYSSSYTDGDGNVRHMATSKFEPTYARQAFPCFDEPNLKATYKVHLLRPNEPDYIALSNYPVENEETVPEGVMVHFEETVPMSTYLSCFIVSDFKSTNTTFNNKGREIDFRVYASPHQLEKTNYAGEVGKKIIEFYVDYFNLAYPLPKLDMVAIPDFVSGAMEHWGLVTYRETALLYDNSTHSASNKQRVAEVVAHELAHSWFGNLVTMDWWNNLWLNEGFASYIEYKGVASAEPSWKMLEQFQIGTLHSILSLDATQGSHPIIQTVETPDQITEVFDSVSYNKGASVLRMLESVVGDQNFKNGVTNYLNNNEYANAVTEDLWREIQAVVGDQLNITEFMDSFTVQMGYPILEARVTGNTYTFTQKRFLKDYDTARAQRSSPLNYKWNVPVTYVTDVGHSDEIYWFKHNANSLVIEKPANAKWIKFNPDQVGYYRVNYPENEWKGLISYIKDMSVSDRTHLLEESFSIAESGELSYQIPLSLTKYLTEEREYIPWSVASAQLQQILRYLQNSQHDSSFKKYIVSLLKPSYERLTWDDSNDEEEHLEKLNRVVILNLACAVDDDAALDEAKTRFSTWLSDPSEPISPNLRTIIYKFGMVTADETTWNQLFDIFAAETDANEKLKLMNGLANVRNPSLLTKLIGLAEDETYIRSQDYFTLLQYISANPVGTSIVWDYVRENWEYLVNRFTLNDRYLGRLIPSITSRFSTNVKLEEMRQFFTKYPDAGAGAAARVQAQEAVMNNIKWLSKHKTIVEDWISTNVPTS